MTDVYIHFLCAHYGLPTTSMVCLYVSQSPLACMVTQHPTIRICGIVVDMRLFSQVQHSCAAMHLARLPIIRSALQLTEYIKLYAIARADRNIGKITVKWIMFTLAQ